MAEACRYKYALSVPGYGYASRLKALLLCGAAVVHVAHPWNEFFYPLLVPGRHLVVVRSVQETVSAVRALRANASYASSIAAAGQQFALQHLRMDDVLDYFRAALHSYAADQRQREPVNTSTRGFTRVRSAAEAGWVTLLCNCSSVKPASALSSTNCMPSSHHKHGPKVHCCKGWNCALEVCATPHHADGHSAKEV